MGCRRASAAKRGRVAVIITRRACTTVAAFALACLMLLTGCSKQESAAPGYESAESGRVLDEARRASRSAASFPAADEDYCHDIDSAMALSGDEVKGRNNWIVWTACNDRISYVLSKISFGTLDFLKTF